MRRLGDWLRSVNIYIYILSGPWKLSGRFRCVSVIHVSVTFPLMFPPRFRHVSVAFLLRFRSRFRCASVGQALARRMLPPKTRPTRVRSRGSTFSGVSSDVLPAAPSLGVRCDAGPKVALTRMCFNFFAAASENPRSHWGHVGSSVFQRFRHVSVNVSVTCPSTFPSTFPLRFRYVSVAQVCARWKLSGNPPSVSRAH